jgi:predicted DsbA family dithiol-disulfide isomerase
MTITLYSTHCPKCNILTQKLNQANIQYNEINDVEVMLAKGFSSAPMLEVDGTIMNFYEANNWINERNK